MSWSIRILLGLIAIIVIALIAFGIYYTVIRLDRNGPIEVETYPGAQKVVEETVREGHDHLQFTSTASAFDIEHFYREKGYECVAGAGDVWESGIKLDDVYIRSTCLLDRSHSFGFQQTVRIIIQPNREPVVYQDNDPQLPAIGGGTLTGDVIIDVQRFWGSSGLLGG